MGFLVPEIHDYFTDYQTYWFLCFIKEKCPFLQGEMVCKLFMTTNKTGLATKIRHRSGFDYWQAANEPIPGARGPCKLQMSRSHGHEAFASCK